MRRDSGIRDFCTGATNDDQYSVLQPVTFADLAGHVRTFNDFGPASVNGVGAGIPSIDPRAMDDVLAFQNSLYPGNQRYAHPADSYRVGETTRSAFVMGSFAGTLGVPFSDNSRRARRGYRAAHYLFPYHRLPVHRQSGGMERRADAARRGSHHQRLSRRAAFDQNIFERRYFLGVRVRN